MSFKLRDIVKIKNTELIGKVANINDFRPPETKYAIDVEGASDFIFAGDDDLELLEVENEK